MFVIAKIEKYYKMAIKRKNCQNGAEFMDLVIKNATTVH